jgi:hypothetical protein
MGFLDQVWDDTMAGPAPDKGAGKLRKLNVPPLLYRQGSSPLASPSAEGSPTPDPLTSRRSLDETRGMRGVTQSIAIARSYSGRNSLDHASSLPSSFSGSDSAGSSPRNDSVWRSVFQPGNVNKTSMDRVGAGRFDKQQPNSNSVYDWAGSQ